MRINKSGIKRKRPTKCSGSVTLSAQVWTKAGAKRKCPVCRFGNRKVPQPTLGKWRRTGILLCFRCATYMSRDPPQEVVTVNLPFFTARGTWAAERCPEGAAVAAAACSKAQGTARGTGGDDP